MKMYVVERRHGHPMLREFRQFFLFDTDERWRAVKGELGRLLWDKETGEWWWPDVSAGQHEDGSWMAYERLCKEGS